MKVAILGTGAYGLSLAMVFLENNCSIKMWTKFENEKSQLELHRMNEKVLPGVRIPNEVCFTCDLKYATSDADLIVIAIPVAYIGAIIEELSAYVRKDTHFLFATKGIEQNSCFMVSEILTSYIDTNKYALIFGPSFAIDMANKAVMGLNIITKNKETEEIVSKIFGSDYLKLVTINDLIGASICSTIKNVIAIATGIISGLGLPESSQATFITEAINSISDLVVSLGGSRDTILSYCGIGDLIMTCTSTKSRNFKLGCLIGSGANNEDIERYIENNTVEGLYNLESIYQLLNKNKLKVKLIEVIYNVIINHDDPKKILSI